MGSIPNRGTKIPHAPWCNQKKEKKKKTLHDEVCSSWPSSNFQENSSSQLQKICAWLNILCFPQNHIYTDPLPTSLKQSLRAIWNAVSWAVVLVLPQIKLNWQLSWCAFFFQSTHFKGEVREGTWGFEISLCMILCLADGEVYRAVSQVLPFSILRYQQVWYMLMIIK